jgi:hypothetical protein
MKEINGVMHRKVENEAMEFDEKTGKNIRRVYVKYEPVTQSHAPVTHSHAPVTHSHAPVTHSHGTKFFF